MCLHPDWIYQNDVLSITHSLLTVDCVGPSPITKMENLATEFLKQWLQQPQSALRVILECALPAFPKLLSIANSVCWPMFPNQVIRSFPSRMSFSGSGMFQLNDKHHGILCQAREQLNFIRCTKKLIIIAITEMCTCKLDSLSVQFKDAASLEMSTRLWSRLLLGSHPGQFSFILRVSSDTFPTPMNLQQ